MSKLILLKNEVSGQVDVPDSKSYVHRALFALSVLARKETKIKIFSNNLADDILVTINALKTIGFNISILDKEIKILPTNIASIDVNKTYICNIKESGSTLRFLLPFAGALGIKLELIGEGRLLNRPLNDLQETLLKHGYKVLNDGEKIVTSGKLTSGIYEISASVSSQYITGIILAMLINNDIKLKIKGDVVSRPYIDLTKNVLKELGTEVNEQNNLFNIDNIHGYFKDVFLSEADWSSAATLISLAVTNGSLILQNLNYNSNQSDIKILEFLKCLQKEVMIDKNTIFVSSHNLDNKRSDLTFDISSCPDLAPVLAACIALTNKNVTLKGVLRLKDKESDRLYEIMLLLKQMKREFKQEADELLIYGLDEDVTEVLEYVGSDHRMAMAYAVASLRNRGKTIIDNPSCVNKSFVGFFELLNSLYRY